MLFAGYQAVGTRGRRLVDGEKTVKIHGRDDPGALPHRADRIDVRPCRLERDPALARRLHAPPKTAFIVHGEPAAMEALASRIQRAAGLDDEDAAASRDGDAELIAAAR